MMQQGNKYVTNVTSPLADYLTEGRGIGSTLWGWISYPFSWWSSSEIDTLAVSDQFNGTPVYRPYDNIEIAKHNVTVWCNDQTCTTMKCDKYGCKNVSCNIYDTDLRGECREYNTIVKPEEPVQPTSTPVTEPSLQDKIPDSTKAPETSMSTGNDTNTNQAVEEHPLELEAVLSSTVTEKSAHKGSSLKVDKTASPQNKVSKFLRCA